MIKAIAGNVLPPQVYVGQGRPRPDMLGEIKTSKLNNKPEGALWTSPLIEDQGLISSTWLEFLIAEKFVQNYKSVWLLHPWKRAKLIFVPDLNSYLELIDKFSITPESSGRTLGRLLDFKRLHSLGFDGIFVTETAIKETRFSPERWKDDRLVIGLSAWDVESIAWFNWVFPRVERVKEERLKPSVRAYLESARLTGGDGWGIMLEPVSYKSRKEVR